jgi:hypothetical protein
MAELYRHQFRDHFISAMQAEMGSIKGMNAMEERVMPEDRKAVPLTWKFAYKSNGQFIARFKARICVRGDLQKSGIDYNPDDIYAPVMRGVTLRVSVAFNGTNRKMWITAGDITTAFLNAKPTRNVYVYDPKGFPSKDPGKRLLLLSYLMMMAWMSQQTRLDLCATTSMLAQHLSKPTKSDLAALKWLLKYLRGSWDDVLFYRDEKEGELIAEVDCENAFHAKDKPPGFLVGYADASFGGDPGRKSRTGCVVIARGAAVDWLSKKQSMVALSSTEAEYLSLSQMTQMMAGLRYTLTDLGEEETGKKPSRIYEDNKSCIAIAYKPMHQGRTKHFDIKAHFIRDRIEKGEVEVVYCPTGEMIADMLTKALPAKQHQRLKRFAGLYPLSSLQIIKLNDPTAQ